MTVLATDPAGADDPLTYEFDCDGDGTYALAQASNTFDCSFDDGPSDWTIKVRVTDDDGASDTEQVDIHVDNRAPTGVFSTTSPVFEGSPSTLSWTAYDDPSTADDIGRSSVPVRLRRPCRLSGRPVQHRVDDSTSTCTFFDEGLVWRRWPLDRQRQRGPDGRWLRHGPQRRPDGQCRRRRHRRRGIDLHRRRLVHRSGCGHLDGNGRLRRRLRLQPLTLIGKTFQLSHTYADGPNAYTVSVTVDDGDGGSHTDTLTVTVTNVVPTIALSGAATTNEGATYSLTLGAITDSGDDDVTGYIVHWGDGSARRRSAPTA